MEFCNLKAQYQKYQAEIDEAMKRVLLDSSYINGPAVPELENELSRFTGSKAVACANGTDALQLAMMAVGIGPGDEVITTPFTFVATAEMIAIVGAKPVFVDISEDDFNINVASIEQAITDKTKAIIPVSLYGQMADMDEINRIAQTHNLVVIEDGAQSFGATYKGKKSCNASTLATTSFFPAKPLGCYGDGGAVFTQNEELEQKLRILRNHGQSKRYTHTQIGVNSRLDTLQAAILQVKLKHFPEEIAKRQKLAEAYSAGLKEKFCVPTIMPERTSVWAQYTLRTKNRDALQQKLADAQIPTAIHYPKPLHLQAGYAQYGGKPGDCPVAEAVANEVISLPMSAFLTDAEQTFVIENCLH